MIIGYVIGFSVALVLLIVFFTVYLKSKRLKELRINEVSKLKPGKVSRQFSLNTPLTEERKQHIVLYLNSIGANTLEGKNRELISYINPSSKAVLGGIFNLEATQFPIRIIIAPKENRTEFQLDDNYGFQRFKGTAKAVFEQKNQEAFEHHFSRLAQVIN